MSGLIEQIKEKAKQRRKTIVLPEAHDERVIKAAEKLQKENICSVILLGDENKIREDAKNLNVDLQGVRIINPLKSDKLTDFTNIYFNLRKNKGVDFEKAKETMKNNLFFGAMMVREGMADGFVGGSASPTADVLRAGIHCVGMPEGISIVSSFFLMVLPEKVYAFADCAVVPNPNEEQLADIAISTADNFSKLVGEEPLIAMLSFSTKGSAEHEMVDKVRNATQIVKKKRPDLKVDGELQFDAAIVEKVGKSKAPGSEIAGRANVLIFPDLNAGNIGYKIAQRLGGAEAIGPIVQGLRKPIFDLSRGCSVDDIVNTAAIACLMAD
ncbi:MAG: phosphate acetyltransferase [Ignavibacteria bacterium]|jgi:phosphate acetyltransferase|nr:phosphate acetyltransferase [Ignavibacteria bacterium]MDH7526892.1 phosphate acetyltransferase [Ignavibacteria bacterium]NPV11730.1 phosphate acetyltransferase [Ignavibacteria bacterium]